MQGNVIIEGRRNLIILTGNGTEAEHLGTQLSTFQQIFTRKNTFPVKPSHRNSCIHFDLASLHSPVLRPAFQSWGSLSLAQSQQHHYSALKLIFPVRRNPNSMRRLITFHDIILLAFIEHEIASNQNSSHLNTQQRVSKARTFQVKKMFNL